MSDYELKAKVVHNLIEDMKKIKSITDVLCDLEKIIPPNVMEEMVKADLYLDRAIAKFRSYEKQNYGTIVSV